VSGNVSQQKKLKFSVQSTEKIREEFQNLIGTVSIILNYKDTNINAPMDSIEN